MILDVGPQTAKQFADMFKAAKTILWNGPVGVFEVDSFGNGTKELSLAIAQSDAFSIAGGGDTWRPSTNTAWPNRSLTSLPAAVRFRVCGRQSAASGGSTATAREIILALGDLRVCKNENTINAQLPTQKKKLLNKRNLKWP